MQQVEVVTSAADKSHTVIRDVIGSFGFQCRPLGTSGQARQSGTVKNNTKVKIKQDLAAFDDAQAARGFPWVMSGVETRGVVSPELAGDEVFISNFDKELLTPLKHAQFQNLGRFFRR